MSALTYFGKQFSFIFSSTILSFFSLFCITVFVDPFHASLLTFVFFYASLFLSVTGLFTIFGFLLRKTSAHKLFIVSLTDSLRQAGIIGFITVLIFMLLAKDLLNWVIFFNLILLAIFIETVFYFKTGNSRFGKTF